MRTEDFQRRSNSARKHNDARTAHDCRVRHQQAAFGHHLDQVSEAEFEAQLYHLTHKTMISRSKWRPSNSSSKPGNLAITPPSTHQTAGKIGRPAICTRANSSYSAYLGGIGGWWLAGFFHLPWMAWMPAFPSSDATAMMILFCTSVASVDTGGAR